MCSLGPKIRCVVDTQDMGAFWVHVLWKNWHFVGLDLLNSGHFDYIIGMYFFNTKATRSHAKGLEKMV